MSTLRVPALIALLLLLPACSGHEGASTNAGDTTSATQAQTASEPAPVRMAYSYIYRFAVPAAQIGTAQDRHMAMCERAGAGRCRLLEIHRSVGQYGGGSLKLEVASGFARSFAAGLAAPVEALGGSLRSNDVEAEDVGRQIVDVQARVRAKEALAARLNQILRTRSGSTADLVSTEKAVADVQEALDAARTALAQAQGRIDTSPLEISYEQQATFGSALGDAFGEVGGTVSSSIVTLIYFLAAAAPWLVVAGLLFLGGRALRRRLRERGA